VYKPSGVPVEIISRHGYPYADLTLGTPPSSQSSSFNPATHTEVALSVPANPLEDARIPSTREKAVTQTSDDFVIRNYVDHPVAFSVCCSHSKSRLIDIQPEFGEYRFTYVDLDDSWDAYEAEDKIYDYMTEHEELKNVTEYVPTKDHMNTVNTARGMRQLFRLTGYKEIVLGLPIPHSY